MRHPVPKSILIAEYMCINRFSDEFLSKSAILEIAGCDIMKIPVIVVNVKTYETGTGDKSLELAKMMAELAKARDASLAIAVQPTDIRLVANCGIPVLAQHVDPISYGNNTGYILPEAVEAAGAVGTLINHAERKLTLAQIEALVAKCKELGFVSIVCTNNVSTSAAAAALAPDFIAVEPPELIGGDISVTTANPEIVKNSVSAVKAISKDVHVLCGAGVKNGKDVKKAIELGADGVLLASGVAKAKDPRAALEDLISGLK